MTKEDKRILFCKLLDSRAHGDGPAKLAKWCRSSPSTIYLWQKPEGPWPREEKEARLWAFFGYELDERGNPIVNNAAQEAPLPAPQEVLPTQVQSIIESLKRNILTAVDEYSSQMQSVGVVKENRGRIQQDVSLRARPQRTTQRRRAADRRIRDRRTIVENKSKNTPSD